MRMEKWKTVLPNKDCRCSFRLAFVIQVAANLMLPIKAPITVYLPQLEISVHPSTMQHLTNIMMTADPPPKAVLRDVGKEIDEFMSKHIDENSHVEQKNIIVSSLISSDLQCLKSMKSEDSSQTQLPGIVQIKEQLVNLKCSDHNCSLSVNAISSTQNNKLSRLCSGCVSLVSDINHDTWNTLSFKGLEGTTSVTVDVALTSLSQFAMSLLADGSIDEHCGETSIMYSKKLVECNLPQLSIPLLISVLQHACEHAQAYEAYTLLATALQQVLKDDVDMVTERWLLQAACDYFTQLFTQNTSSLPDMNTSLCEILDHILLTNSTALKLVEMAANFQASTDPTIFQHVLTQLLTVYTKASSGPIKDHGIQGTIDILTGICDLFTMKETDSVGLSVDKIVHGIWRNPDLCQVAAKVVTTLIPKTKNYSQQQNIIGIVKVPQTAPEQKLYTKEMKVKDCVSKGELTHVQAAMWYLDLLVADKLVYQTAQKAMCLLKAAQHFECAFNIAKVLSDKVSLRNAALTCTYDACHLVKRMHPGFRVMTFQLALEITFRLAVVDVTFPSQKCQDAIMAAGVFNNLVYNRQFTFIHCFPFTEIFVSDALFFDRISDMAQREYLKNVMNLKESALHIRPSLLKHQCFENAISDHMHGRETDESLFRKREIMISSFAREKGLTDNDISDLMTSSSMPRDSEGWLIPNKPLGQHMDIASLRGFCLDYSDRSPTIQLLIEPAKDGNGLLSLDDVFTILQLEQNEVFPIRFSLDPPSAMERYHPFKDLICHPAKLQNTEYMDALFQADYLLKFFTTGAEVSSQPPFHLKPTEQGLLKSLPKDIQHILRPTHSRGSSRFTRNRSWIEVEEIQYGEEITEEVATYFIQAVKVVVRSHPLVSGINGRIYDAQRSETGPHALFAADFTANYDKIAQHFLVFARLRELAKLQFMMQKIYDYLQTKKQASKSVYLAFTSELNRLRSLAPNRKSKKECTWVPGTLALCGKGTCVYGGVLLKPRQKEYYNLPGNNVPDGSSGANWKNAYNKVVSPILDLETMPGGIYFGIKHQYRVPVDVTETENIICMTLGKQSDSDSSNAALTSFSDSNACSIETEAAVVPKYLPHDESSENTSTITPHAPEHVQALPVDPSPTSAEPMTSSREDLQTKGQSDYDSNSDPKLKDANIANKTTHETEPKVGPKCVPHVESSENTSTFTPNAPEHVQALPVDPYPTSAEPMTGSREDLQTKDQSDYDSYSDAKLKDTDTVNDDDFSNEATPDIHSETEPEVGPKCVPHDESSENTSTITPNAPEHVQAPSIDPSPTSAEPTTGSREDLQIKDKSDYDSNSDAKLKDTNIANKTTRETEPHIESSENTGTFTPNAPEHVQALPVDPSPTSAEPITGSREDLQTKGQSNYDSNSDAKLKDADTVNDDNVDNVTTPDIENGHVSYHDDPTINPDDIKSEDDDYAKRITTTLDSFLHFFHQSPLNLAVFGNKMKNLGMLNTTTNGSYTPATFHPNKLVQEQVMNVIVLQHMYRTQGFDARTLSQ